MIAWMGNDTERLIDEVCPWLVILVCEIHSDELKGHIVLQFGGIDEDNFDGYQLDLGDCMNLSHTDIDRRFRKRFAKMVEDYGNSDECCGVILEDLLFLSNELNGKE